MRNVRWQLVHYRHGLHNISCGITQSIFIFPYTSWNTHLPTASSLYFKPYYLSIAFISFSQDRELHRGSVREVHERRDESKPGPNRRLQSSRLPLLHRSLSARTQGTQWSTVRLLPRWNCRLCMQPWGAAWIKAILEKRWSKFVCYCNRQILPWFWFWIISSFRSKFSLASFD